MVSSVVPCWKLSSHLVHCWCYCRYSQFAIRNVTDCRYAAVIQTGQCDVNFCGSPDTISGNRSSLETAHVRLSGLCRYAFRAAPGMQPGRVTLHDASGAAACETLAIWVSLTQFRLKYWTMPWACDGVGWRLFQVNQSLCSCLVTMFPQLVQTMCVCQASACVLNDNDSSCRDETFSLMFCSVRQWQFVWCAQWMLHLLLGANF